MKFSKNPLKTIYAVWFALWTFVSFMLLYPLIRYALSNPKRYPLGHKIRRFWGWILLTTGFVRITQIVEESFDTSKPSMTAAAPLSINWFITNTLNPTDWPTLARLWLDQRRGYSFSAADSFTAFVDTGDGSRKLARGCRLSCRLPTRHTRSAQHSRRPCRLHA